jgi:diguanylate cyclase (GGDEF)-like protein
MRAQMAAFTNQVPLLYFILCVNTLAVAYSLHGTAPDTLTVAAPVALVSICMVRLVIWSRSRRRVLSDRTIARRLRGTMMLGSVIAAAFLAWGLALFPYGDIRAQGQVVFFIGITMVSSIFCLMHLRPAALLLTGIMTIPFTAFLFTTGDQHLIAIAVNLLLVSAAMVYVLIVASRDFASLVKSKTEAKRLSDENARLAHVDALTDLPNRRQFFLELTRALTECDETGKVCSVGLLDLDGFKPVNDRFGHIAGDQVLNETGKKLRAAAGPDVFIARLGGDEFGIILHGRASEAELLSFGEKVCSALQAPYEVMGVVANISASIGFASYAEAGTTANTLYEHADYALYHAKGHQRGRPMIFSAKHEFQIRENRIIEQCLRSADLDAQLSLHFQPLFDVRQNRPLGFEALARWHSPELGNVSPGVFIPIAERSELINRITQCLLRKALAAASEWPEDIRISFNLSARDIVSPAAFLGIVAILEKSPVDPKRIDLEVTETSIVEDFEQARQSLLLLKSLGVNIALDDFGTGYSSLSHIHRLPLDKIKIDRSFIQDIETQKVSHSVIRSVIGLCANLNMDCVIEGMETANQAQILRDLGCTTMQGYFFGRPVRQDEVAGLIARAAIAGGRSEHLPALQSA